MTKIAQILLCIAYMLLGSAMANVFQNDLIAVAWKLVLAVFLGLMSLDVKISAK